jgi:hypothetical protein
MIIYLAHTTHNTLLNTHIYTLLPKKHPKSDRAHWIDNIHDVILSTKISLMTVGSKRFATLNQECDL